MELRQMIKILIRWWWLVAIPVVLVGGYAVLTYSTPATQYQVIVSFATGTEPAGLSVDYDRYYPWLTSEYIANGLADIAVTDAFADAVTARLVEAGVEISGGTVKGHIVSDNAQSIVRIYLTWPDPIEILAIADAISAEIMTNGAAYFPQLSGLGIAARRLDDPVPVPLPPSLRAQLLGPGLKVLLAAAVGVGLAFLAHYLDPTVRERAEVEALDIPVLVTVPR